MRADDRQILDRGVKGAGDIAGVRVGREQPIGVEMKIGWKLPTVSRMTPANFAISMPPIAPGQPIIIRLALPPAAVVLMEVDTSSSSQLP